jgi:hypothetical protein
VLLDGKPATAPQLEHEPGADVRPQAQIEDRALGVVRGRSTRPGMPMTQESTVALPPSRALR